MLFYCLYVFLCTQYYHLYANVHSNVISFNVSHFEGFATRVAVLLDDGSVRIMSPPTGNTLAIIYPLPLMQVRKANVKLPSKLSAVKIVCTCMYMHSVYSYFRYTGCYGAVACSEDYGIFMEVFLFVAGPSWTH